MTLFRIVKLKSMALRSKPIRRHVFAERQSTQIWSLAPSSGLGNICNTPDVHPHIARLRLSMRRTLLRWPEAPKNLKILSLLRGSVPKNRCFTTFNTRKRRSSSTHWAKKNNRSVKKIFFESVAKLPPHTSSKEN